MVLIKFEVTSLKIHLLAVVLVYRTTTHVLAGRFCDGLGCGEGVIGSAGAFAALLEALVRPFDVVEYDGRSLLYFFVLVLLPPAIVPNSSRWYRCE